MAINADALMESMTPPSIVIGGVTYTGNLVGTEQMVPFQMRFEAMEDNQTPISDVVALAGDLCDAMGIPREKVLALPPLVMVAAIKDFLACHWVAGTPSPNLTLGSSSPPAAAGNRKARRASKR